MIRQGDDRTTLGLRTKYGFVHRFDRVTLTSRIGANFRYDAHRQHPAGRAGTGDHRTPESTPTSAKARVGVFAEEELHWNWLRIVGGAPLRLLRASTSPTASKTRAPRAPRPAASAPRASSCPKGSVIAQPVDAPRALLQLRPWLSLERRPRRRARYADPVTPSHAGARLGARRAGHRLGALPALRRVLLAEARQRARLGGRRGHHRSRTARPEGSASRRSFGSRSSLGCWPTSTSTWVRAQFVNNPGNANAVALAPELLLSGGLTARDDANRTLGSPWRLLHRGPARPPKTGSSPPRASCASTPRSAGTIERFGVQAQLLNRLQHAVGAKPSSQRPGASRGRDAPGDCPSWHAPGQRSGRRTSAGCEDIHFTARLADPLPGPRDREVLERPELRPEARRRTRIARSPRYAPR